MGRLRRIELPVPPVMVRTEARRRRDPARQAGRCGDPWYPRPMVMA
jgi:hypothetical protein